MASFLPKSHDQFVYIQVEAGEIIFQVFRFQERAYDAVLLRTRSVTGDFRSAESVAAVLPAYLNEARSVSHSRLIIGLHSGLFSTAQTTVTLRRDKPEQLVSEAELENLISSGLWKINSRQQRQLARKLNIVESATVFIGAFIASIRVDGHRVASPVGFSAHTIEFTVCYSVSSHMLYQTLLPFLSGEQEVYCTEIGMSELFRLASQVSDRNFLLVRVSEAHTYVYAAVESEQEYLDTINWGRNSLIGSFEQELMMSREQTGELLRRAESGLTSIQVRRRVEALLLQEVSVLLKGIGAHTEHSKATAIYISAPFTLPASLFTEAAAKRAGISIPVVAMPDNSHGEKTQSALPLSMKTTASSISALCANAWAAHRFFEQSDVQKIAKRRVRWLAHGSS